MNLRKPRVYKDAGGWWTIDLPDGGRSKTNSWDVAVHWAVGWWTWNHWLLHHLEPCS